VQAVAHMSWSIMELRECASAQEAFAVDRAGTGRNVAGLGLFPLTPTTTGLSALSDRQVGTDGLRKARRGISVTQSERR